jgi:ubiquinone/menaquinone biosynthesis C-methylase UbiE
MKGIDGKRVLDYGCGYGDLTYAISKANSVVGIDVDAARIEFCRQQYSELEFREFDGHRAPFPDGAFDVVLSSVVLPFVADHSAYLAEIRRVIAKYGTLVLITRNISVVDSTLRRVLRRPDKPPRLNVTPRSQTRRQLAAHGFDIECEDYFYDPPFVDWKSPSAFLVGLVEQLLSMTRCSRAAGYIAWRAHAT